MINLLVRTLSTFDSKAKYKLTADKEVLILSLKVPLSIYNFTWEFAMQRQPNFDTRKLIMKDIIGPLTASLLAQETRCTAIESRVPASDRLDSEKDWATLSKNCRDRGFNDLGASSKYFLTHVNEGVPVDVV